MAKRIITPFAEIGDREAMPDTPSGSDSNYQTGYTPEYQQDPVVNPSTAKFVERDKANQLYNDITSNIKEWQEHVYPAFITAANNGGAPFAYKKGSIVTLLDVDYISTENNNTDVPPSDKWEIVVGLDEPSLLDKRFSPTSDNVFITIARTGTVINEIGINAIITDFGTLKLWDQSSSFSNTEHTVELITANSFSGYDVVTNHGTFEFVTYDIYSVRGGNGGIISPKGWGWVAGAYTSKSNDDDTLWTIDNSSQDGGAALTRAVSYSKFAKRWVYVDGDMYLQTKPDFGGGGFFIFQHPQTKIVLKNETTNVELRDCNDWVWSNLNVDGNYENWTSNSAYTVALYNAHRFNISDGWRVVRGINAGIGLGQSYDGSSVLTPNSHGTIGSGSTKKIGLQSQSGFYAYGNGLAVVAAHDMIIGDMTHEDTYGVAGVNLEGPLAKDIKFKSITVRRTRGNAAGFKSFKQGVDLPSDNVTVDELTLENLSVDGSATLEPAIWIQSTNDITIKKWVVMDCAYGGYVTINSGNNVRLGVGKFLRNKEARFVLNSCINPNFGSIEHISPVGATLTEPPIYLETSSTTTSVSDFSGVFRVEKSFKSPFEIVARSPMDLTGQRIINCMTDTSSTSYMFSSSVGFKYCILGGNQVQDDISTWPNRLIAMYNFSGSEHVDARYIPDQLDILDKTNFVTFDTTSNLNYIQSYVGVKTGPPTTGYNFEGRIQWVRGLTAASAYRCTVSGTPGTWVPI